MKKLSVWDKILIFFGLKKKPVVQSTPTKPVEQPPIIISPEPERPAPEFQLNWPDRRPIGMIMLASYQDPWNGTNNWKLLGQYQFSREALLAHADECIKNMKALNAQGMITWNIEGEKFWHNISYIGDPRLIPAEMDVLADEYFKRFTDAGFLTGVCIRPTLLLGEKQTYTDDISEVLLNKINYAKSRWGCRLFYIDSNVDATGALISGEVLKKIMTKHPDILLCPEWEGEIKEYWQYAAPFKWLYQYRTDVVPAVKAKVKHPFMVLSIGDHDGDLIQSVSEGNILMFRAWYQSPEQIKVKQAYDALGKSA